MWQEYLTAVIDRYRRRTELLVCKHDWIKVESFNEYRKDGTTINNTRVTYVCRYCGDFKQIML